MIYLLDANCLIQAQNVYYDFDVFPAFWAWIEQQNKLNVVYSISKVGEELKKRDDQIAEWAKQRGADFFLDPDPATVAKIKEVATWVSSYAAGFTPQSLPSFLNGADLILVAHALAHDYTIVTQENLKNSPGKNGQVTAKIPNVCQHFNVPCIKIFDLLKIEKARFTSH